MNDFEFFFDGETWSNELLERFENDGAWANYSLFKLAILAEQSMLVFDFFSLRVKDYLHNFKPLPHQLDTAKTVICKMNGKAILADEVGLGKTIEAGLILKEYLIRGLAKKILILVPASLITQWSTELYEKFQISPAVYKKNIPWNNYDIVISSLDTAKREKNQAEILEIDYDLVIVDEAHKLKNSKTKNYEFAKKIKKKYCLLLTATPIQNRLEEIFSLVSLLKPGLLGNYEDFMHRFSKKNRNTDDGKTLNNLISQVMVRNRREDSGVVWTKRNIETIIIKLSQPERNLYEAVLRFRFDGLSSLLLQREACSSREALYSTAKNIGAKCLEPFIDKVDGNSKAKKALELILQSKEKVLIFTEYKATQLYLQWYFKQKNILSVPFCGGFTRSKRDFMTHLFKTRAQVMVATEAGGEGINLQFCSQVINFDLPWNPMRLEQRIGRIHRYGQTKDVKIIHFVSKNTIEEYIMQILYRKIALFEKVVGELDDILSCVEIKNFEKNLIDILENSQTEGELKIKMDNLFDIVSNDRKNEDK